MAIPRLFAQDSSIKQATLETLDQLWHEAEQLGRVEVDHELGSNAAYRVEIMFTRKSGTRVYARGTNSSIHIALSDAINEAREMGAGTV